MDNILTITIVTFLGILISNIFTVEFAISQPVIYGRRHQIMIKL